MDAAKRCWALQPLRKRTDVVEAGDRAGSGQRRLQQTDLARRRRRRESRRNRIRRGWTPVTWASRRRDPAAENLQAAAACSSASASCR
uniref:Uncharacterized protein n=1 Tax=Triticum urartu TaxID=4572 RepID=A0A8R7RAC6_TRIUA